MLPRQANLSYIVETMQRVNVDINTKGSMGKHDVHWKKLAISREGFINRANILMNKVDEKLRYEEKIEKFKYELRKWVLGNI